MGNMAAEACTSISLSVTFNADCDEINRQNRKLFIRLKETKSANIGQAVGH